MFGLLKSKLANFIKGLSGKEEEKVAGAPPEERKPEVIEEKKTVEQPKPAEAKPVHKTEPKAEKEAGPKPVEKKAAEEKKPEKKETPKPKPAEAKHVSKVAEKKAGPTPVEKPAEKKAAPQPVEVKPAPKPIEAKPVAKPAETNKVGEKKAEPSPVAAPPKQAGAPKKEEPKKSIIDVLFRKPAPAEAPKPQAAQPKPAEAQKPAAQPEKPAAQPMQKIPAPQPKPDEPLPEMSRQAERDFSQLARRAASAPEKRETAPKIGIGTALKSIFSNEITIGEAEVSGLLSELELSLLEADVAYDVSLDVSSQLRARLVGMKVPKGKVEERTREAIQGVLASVMTSDRKFDMVGRVRGLEKPAKILFVGPNGAGKTTTMAKVAHMLLAGGLTCVFSASDTFRAAAIEQTEVHAGRLGIKVVKSKYGADPASVAFEAVSFARAHNIDVVLIDSAGRQDTNANLLDELKKISRVAKPDIKIYIGESIGGNSLIDQVRAFDEAIGMDGAILTKIDCDAKGGTALSLTKSTGIPVLYLGVGQAYADLVPFEPEKIAREIMG